MHWRKKNPMMDVDGEGPPPLIQKNGDKIERTLIGLHFCKGNRGLQK